MIRVTADTEKARALVVRLRDGLTPAQIDPIVERVAFQTMAALVEASPKKWFGQIKSGWAVTTPHEGARLVGIPAGRLTASGRPVSDIVRFVNFGTADDGAGWIYPTRAKRLFIPLKRSAAAGWRPGMVYGDDYILRFRVRGIKGRHFIEPVIQKSLKWMLIALRAFVVGLVRK